MLAATTKKKAATVAWCIVSSNTGILFWRKKTI